MNSNNSIIKIASNFRSDFLNAAPADRVVLTLLFLFPIGATYIRHWVSLIFVALFFYSCFCLIKNKNISFKLEKEEKILVLIFILHFSIFVISALINGWGKNQTYALGVELRFLIVIPLYFLLREIKCSYKYLLIGSVLGLVGGLLFGFYEFHQHQERFSYFRITGIYGYLFIGPVSVLFTFVVSSLFYNVHFNLKFYIWILFAGGLIAFFSSAKSSWVAFFLSTLIIMYFNSDHKKNVVYVLLICMFIPLVIYYVSDKYREPSLNFAYIVDRTSNQFLNYFKSTDKSKSKHSSTGVGLRFEAWRSTIFTIKNSPFLGIGQGNFHQKIIEHIEQGKLHVSLSKMGHAHNVFVEMLINRGVIGFVIVIMLYFYPLYLFIKYRNIDRNIAIAGILFITCMTIFSLTESAPLIKNNFVAIFLIFLTTIFSAFINKKKEYESSLKA